MCQQTHLHHAPPEPPDSSSSSPFPWDEGVFDAHCHPTDTMAASMGALPAMKASALVVMATRSQDQQLVAEMASKCGVYQLDAQHEHQQQHQQQHQREHQQEVQQEVHPSSQPSTTSTTTTRIIPSFGWHPWFSHQLYDDVSPAATSTEDTSPTFDPSRHGGDMNAAKTAHYQAVLTPAPSSGDSPSSSSSTSAFLAHLPTPTPLSALIAQTSANLTAFPAALVGEVGLDKAFRLPREWEPAHEENQTREDHPSLTPGGREGRLLSPHRVRMAHQQAVLRAQLALAGALGRAVSVHGVQAHGVLFDTVAACWKGHERRAPSRRQRKMVAPGAEEEEEEDSESDQGQRVTSADALGQKGTGSRPGKPYPPRICLHSFSGSPEVLKQWFNPSVPAEIFASFSTAVNLGNQAGAAKFADVVRAVPDDRVLVESDLDAAGEAMDAALEDLYRRVCHVKGWELRDGVQRIRRNFERFVFG